MGNVHANSVGARGSAHDPEANRRAGYSLSAYYQELGSLRRISYEDETWWRTMVLPGQHASEGAVLMRTGR